MKTVERKLERGEKCMVEQYVDRIHSEHAVLDIGQDIGALVIYTKAELRGRQIDVRLTGSDAKPVHTDVLERRVRGKPIFAAVFPTLLAGDYTILSIPLEKASIVGGRVAEVDWRDRDDVYVPTIPFSGQSHAHVPGTLRHTTTTAPTFKLQEGAPEGWVPTLPPRYLNGQAVCTTPMGAASLRYTEDGQVAWDEMWTDFCDLALAGGPPHRGTMLEPVTPDEVAMAPQDYERVVKEIERGLRLVTGRPILLSTIPGWVGLQCDGEQMALWLQHAIIVENVSVKREGAVLLLPAGPAFTLEEEIKNVITVVAKTHHYWTEHLMSM